MPSAYLHQDEWARVVFGISVAAFAAGEFSQAVKRRRAAARPDWPREVVFRVVFFGGILLLPLARTVAPGAAFGGAGVFVVGLIIGWCGLLVRWWSFVTLGSYFTTVVMTSPDQVVVSRGPYRVLRHPSYSGLLAAFVGCGLMLGNWVGLGGSSLLILLALVYRLKHEERALAEALGDPYRAFARTRARLIPFVW